MTSSSLLQSYSMESELTCTICHDLLHELPEEEVTVPTSAKRQRRDEDEGVRSPEPVPSTSSASSSNPPFSALSSSQSSSNSEETPELCTTSCGHIYHKSCILGWLKRKKECPSCRRPKVTPGRLTRVFLPLTPGQCRQCKERVKQVECAQFDYALAESRADECEKQRHELEVTTEKLSKEKTHLEEKLEDSKIDVVAQNVAFKLLQCELRYFERERDQRLEDFELERQQMEEKFKNDVKTLIEKHNEELRKVTKNAEEELQKHKVNKSRDDRLKILKAENEHAKSRDWEGMYKLARMEVDYEREKAKYFESWCLRFCGNEQLPVNSDILELTNAMRKRLYGDGGKVNSFANLREIAEIEQIQKDTKHLSDSEDNEDENTSRMHVITPTSTPPRTTISSTDHSHHHEYQVGKTDVTPAIMESSIWCILADDLELSDDSDVEENEKTDNENNNVPVVSCNGESPSSSSTFSSDDDEV